MKMKKWNSPSLISYGQVEQITQVSRYDVVKISGFLLPDQEFCLLASLEI